MPLLTDKYNPIWMKHLPNGDGPSSVREALVRCDDDDWPEDFDENGDEEDLPCRWSNKQTRLTIQFSYHSTSILNPVNRTILEYQILFASFKGFFDNPSCILFYFDLLLKRDELSWDVCFHVFLGFSVFVLPSLPLALPGFGMILIAVFNTRVNSHF